MRPTELAKHCPTAFKSDIYCIWMNPPPQLMLSQLNYLTPPPCKESERESSIQALWSQLMVSNYTVMRPISIWFSWNRCGLTCKYTTAKWRFHMAERKCSINTVSVSIHSYCVRAMPVIQRQNILLFPDGSFFTSEIEAQPSVSYNLYLFIDLK